MNRLGSRKKLRTVIGRVIAVFIVAVLLVSQGNFSALASTGGGAAENAVRTTATVIRKAVTISGQPKDVTVTVGSYAKFSVTATGTGTLTYQWQAKSPSGDWVNSSSASAKTANFSIKAQSGHNNYQFRCVITDGSGKTTTSNAAKLTVKAATPPTITTQPADTTVTVGDTANFSVVATGTGTLTYQWQAKSPSGDWKNSSSPSAKTADFSIKAQSGHNNYQFRCVITDGNGKTTTSDAAKLTVKAANPPSITTQPVDTTVMVGNTANFSVVATGTGTLTYQWQAKSPSGDWKNSSSPSAKTADFSIKAQAAHNNYQFRCIITDGNGKTTTSNAAKLTVKAANPPSITTQPADTTVTVGENANFSVVATGTGTLTYQWQAKSPSGDWKNSSSPSAKTADFSIKAQSGHNNYQFRCVITDGNGKTTTSNAAKLTVKAANPPSITTQPADTTVTVGDTANFSVAATGMGTLTYQWQAKSPSGDWKNSSSPSAKTADFSIKAQSGHNNYQFRCIITDGNGKTTTSNAAKLTVKAANPPSITTQPADTTVTAGEYASFSVAATGYGTLTYQWQAKRPGGDWVNSSSASAKTADFSIKAQSGHNNYQFRCIITDGNGKTTTSDAAKLTVEAANPPVITTQPADTTVMVGENANFSVVATGTGTLTYQWQAKSPSGDWKNSSSPSAKTADFSIKTQAAHNNFQFRCIITDGNGKTTTSDAAKLTVKPAYTDTLLLTTFGSVTEALYAAEPGSDLIIVVKYSSENGTCGEGWEVGGVCIDGSWTVDWEFAAFMDEEPVEGKEYTYIFSVDDILAAASDDININFYNGCEIQSVTLREYAVEDDTETDGVNIAEAFPDAGFRAYVSDRFDLNNSGILSKREISKARVIDVSGNDNVQSLVGLEIFESLTKLSCCELNLTSLDVSALTALQQLDCSNNRITSLTLGELDDLISIRCIGNDLTEIDASGCTRLTPSGVEADNVVTVTYACDFVQINDTNFPDDTFRSFVWDNIDDIDSDGWLSEEECLGVFAIYLSYYGDISSLKGIEYFPNLTELYCDGNNLESLDLSANIALEILHCSDNDLDALDLSANQALKDLSCAWNPIDELQLDNNTELEYLCCDNTDISSLDTSALTKLSILECSGNTNLTSLNLKNNTLLERLCCHDCAYLGQLDLSGMESLLRVECSSSNLTALNLDGCSGLTTVWCSYNALDSLDFSNCPNIEEIRCESNGLEDLDLTGCTKLRLLDCNYNGLEELSLDDCSALLYLNCSGNGLTELKLDSCKDLMMLLCDDNALESLDLQQCTGLFWLSCTSNSIQSLNLIKCKALNTVRVLAGDDTSVIYYSDIADPQMGSISTVIQRGDVGSVSYAANTAESGSAIEVIIEFLEPYEFEPAWDGDVYYIGLLGDYDLDCSESHDAGDLVTYLFDVDSYDFSSFDTVIAYDGFRVVTVTLIEPVTQGADESDGYVIDETFPDETFRAYVAENFDLNGTGILSKAEAGFVSSLDLSGLAGISDLTGISVFTELKELDCRGTSITSLDLSDCNNLVPTRVYVDDGVEVIYGTGIITISETAFPDDNFRMFVSETLDRNGDGCLTKSEINRVTEIDVSNCEISMLNGLEYFTELQVLKCANNQLSVLNVDSNTKLEYLDCGGNRLQELDLQALWNLEVLYCQCNALTSLSLNPAMLEQFDCSNNNLSSLGVTDTSEFINLKTLVCHDNPLENVSYGDIPSLETLNCGNTWLTALDVQSCGQLTSLVCYANVITSLNVSNLTSLTELNCSANSIAELNLEGCTALRSLHCDNNPLLQELDVSDCTALRELSCTMTDISVLDLSACKRLKEKNVEVDEGVTVTYYVNPDGDRDLDGLNVVIGDWWSGDNWEFPRETEAQNRYADYQEDMMATYNYTIERKTVYGWGDQAETALLSIVMNEPLADVFVFDHRFLGSFMDMDVIPFADVSQFSEFDFSDEKWNSSVIESMTVGDAIYGFSADMEPRTGVFLNLDLIESLLGEGAGNLPYDWQASGEWTWEKFREFALSLTRDYDGDGMTDVYGFATQQSVFFESAMVSNGHAIVSKDSNGNYVNNALSDDIISDCNWAYSFYTDGITRVMFEDEMWDYFNSMFCNESAAMLIGDEYLIDTLSYYECDFNIGFVNFPKGPNANGYISIQRENVMVIPLCQATEGIVEDIAFAVNIFLQDDPDATPDEDAWKAPYEMYFGYGSRAVTETIDSMLHTNARFMEPSYLIPGLWDNNNGLIQCDLLYCIDDPDRTPEQLLGSINDELQDILDAFNTQRVK